MRKLANTALNLKTPILPSAAVNPFLTLDENGFDPRLTVPSALCHF